MSRRSASRVASLRHAFAGLGHMLRTQPDARIHAAITLSVIILGTWLDLGRIEWAILWLAIGVVWATEFMNTALEALIDLTSPDVHPLAKIGKDVAAGAVLLAAGATAVAGFFILGPPLWVRIIGSDIR